MTFSSPRAFRATSRPSRHHDRALTLVFGSDGQVSLIGFDGGISSQVPQTPSASNAGALTSGATSVPAPGSLAPNLEATSASSGGTSSLSLTPTPTRTTAPVAASSSYGPSSTATDTDTNLPSVPTLSFPAPSPTPASHPDDHSAGAPFYLALVLASISLVGCVAAFIAWWIRSRARSPDFELNDPWHHRSAISDSGSPFAGGENVFEKGIQRPVETQTMPYYLPASLVRRTSSDLLPIPHTVSSREDDVPQNDVSRMTHALRAPSFRRTNHPKDLTPAPDPSRTISLSRTPNWRPGTERLPTGLSVQESARTLGRLRVANRVPGDVTSGDEGGINALRPQNRDGPLPAANTGDRGTFLSEKNLARNIESDKSLPDDVPLEPPGPATLPWGRRMDTIAALRRTRRRTPGADQTYQNIRSSEYPYSTFDQGTGGAILRSPPVANQTGAEGIQENPLHHPLGWTSTLKSSFWQAVDAMTGSRTSDPESRPENDTPANGSRFTPVPQRVASRRSAVSPIRSAAQNPLSDTHTVESQEARSRLLGNSQAVQETFQNVTRPEPEPGNLLATPEVSEAPQISRVTIGRLSSAPKISRLNRDLGEGTHPRHPDSLRTETGSVYSTDSAAARANLRKYGYGDSVPIPSSWSALGRTRESQLDLDRPIPFLPLPRPVSRSSLTPLSITPSQLAFDSVDLSSAASTRTRIRTPVQSLSDLVGSDVSTSRSGKSASATSYREMPRGSSSSMSRNGTVQSGHTILSQDSHGVSSHSSAAISSMLSRKKGVTRKRPRPPPRAPSSASSAHSIESGLSIREVAVRRALLERRKKMKAADSIKGREDASHSSDVDSLPT